MLNVSAALFLSYKPSFTVVTSEPYSSKTLKSIKSPKGHRLTCSTGYVPRPSYDAGFQRDGIGNDGLQ